MSKLSSQPLFRHPDLVVAPCKFGHGVFTTKFIPADTTLEECHHLRIGEEETRTEYLFFKINSIGLDREENIYVADEGEKHIKVFSRDGGYLRTIGRQGQGPGEFGRPTRIFVTANNELMRFSLPGLGQPMEESDGGYEQEDHDPKVVLQRPRLGLLK